VGIISQAEIESRGDINWRAVLFPRPKTPLTDDLNYFLIKLRLHRRNNLDVTRVPIPSDA